MDDKIRELIGHATSRVESREAERGAAKMRRDEVEKERDAENFRHKVEGVLGKDVLDAIWPVSFHNNFLRQSMTFQQDSRTFRLQQQTGFLVQLEENGRMLGHQFNLETNPDSRDTFLYILGAALNAKDSACGTTA